MKVTLAFIATLLLCLNAQAQVRKCTGPDGHVTYTETACSSSAKSAQSVDIPLSNYQVPAHKELGKTASRSRADSERQETIRLMIFNGKLDEARAYARTPEERAIVAQASPPKSKHPKWDAAMENIERSNKEFYKKERERGNRRADMYRDLARRP